MATTPNMTLTTWTNLSDRFNYLELADNFLKIDGHDHAGEGGVKIPAGGLDSLSVATSSLQNESVTKSKLAKPSVGPSEIENGAITTGKIADAAITYSKMSSSVSSNFQDAIDQALIDLQAMFITPEEWRLVGSPSNPSFQNSWTNLPGFYSASFYKDPFKRVWLKGGIVGGSLGDPAFTLPTGYRPPSSEQFGMSQSTVTIEPTGIVRPGATSIGWVNLHGISFRVA